MPGDVSLSGIEFTIKGSTDAASASVDNLVNKLGQLKAALSKISSATAVVALERLKTALESFNTGAADKVVTLFSQIGNAFAYMDASSTSIAALASLSSSLSSLSNSTGDVDGAVSALTQIAAVDYQGLQDASEGLKSLATATRAISKLSENPENIADVVTWLSKLATIDFSNLSEAASSINTISTSAKAIASAGNSTKNVSEGIKDIGKSAKSANSPLSTLLSSIKRIAFYRIIRSVIKSITEAFSEGLENAYEWSRTTSAAISDLYENASEAMADFGNSSLSLSQSLDLISTVSQTMKNQLGAAFGTLLQSLTPIITYLIRLITSLASAVTRLIAILSGKSTYLQAVDVWTEWGDAASDAGSSAKDALKYLAPFDELNRLPDASSSGSGSSNGTDYGDMFQEVSTDVGSGFLDTLTNAFQNLANWFESKDWQDIGSQIWEYIKSIFTDGTKASECVRAFFEAIGSALGALVGTLWGFVSSAVDDIMAQFKNNIKDYNGDSKITTVDILTAILKTGVDILDWVNTNIVTPFVNGFIRALTGNQDFDFKTWATEHIVNPLIEAWNGVTQGIINPVINAINNVINQINDKFGTDIQTIPLIGEIKKIGTSSDVTADSPLQVGGGGKVFKYNLDAEVQSINFDIPNDGSYLGESIDTTTIGGKVRYTLKMWGWMLGLKDEIPQEEKKVPITGNMNAAKDNIPTAQKSTIGTLRYGYVDKTGISDAMKTITRGKLRYASVDKTGISDAMKTIAKGKLRYASADKTGLTDSQKTINTKSKFTTWLNALGTPQIGTTAKLWNFVLDSSIEYYNTGWMIISSILDIVGQKNIPTVKAYVPAAGSGGGGAVYDPNMMKSANANMSYSVDSDSSEEVLYRAMVRALNEPGADGGNITLDGDVIYRSVLNRNKARLRAYGTNPMLTT